MTLEPINSNSDRTNSVLEVHVENRFCAKEDLIETLIHFFNEMIKEQIKIQTEVLKASYEYLKITRIGKHVRKD